MRRSSGARRLPSRARAALLLVALLQAGCGLLSTGAPPAEGPPNVVLGARDYQLRPGDRLRVTVFDQPSLSGELVVAPDGTVAMPLVGDLRLAGESPAAAEAILAGALEPDFLRDAQVRLELLSHRPFYILGEVRRPGAYAYRPGLTVIEAVALAGGYTYRAREDPVTILRRQGARAAEIEGAASTPLLPGDTVRVGARYF